MCGLLDLLLHLEGGYVLSSVYLCRSCEFIVVDVCLQPFSFEFDAYAYFLKVACLLKFQQNHLTEQRNESVTLRVTGSKTLTFGTAAIRSFFAIRRTITALVLAAQL